MNGDTLMQWLEAAVPPLTFLLTLWALLESRVPRRPTRWAGLGFLAVELVVQAVVFALGQSPELNFTLLPLTLYLPAVVWLHLLSGSGFFPTALTWMLALLCDHLLVALRKLLDLLQSSLDGPAWTGLLGGLLASAVLLVLVSRVLRSPFLACTREVEESWLPLLFLPVMLLALYSYFLSSTTDVMVLLLLALTALAVFLVLARLLTSLAEARRTRDARLHMETLRQNYEVLEKKLELGRSYRHDMRHHMAALSALLQEGNCTAAQRYVADWQGQLTQIESETWCRNAAVNGVLSAYLAQAREAGCDLEVGVFLPASFPFEELDLCVVLANALENAIHACQAEPEGAPRRLRLSVALADRRRLTIQVENTCRQAVTFDADGFPAVPHHEGHGQGLHSIAAVAEKYHGLFRCDWKEGRFTLRVVLLAALPEARSLHRVPAVCIGLFLGLFLLNCAPFLAQALEGIPLLGQVVRVADLRTYILGWGSSGLTVRDPVLEGDSSTQALEAEKEAFLRKMEEQFLWYAARKHQGYVAEDVSYDVLRDDEALFTLRFTATLNAGGSVDYSHCVTLDKKTGELIELADLFAPEVNYVFPISREIKAQMAEQNNAGEANYFLPGGIWPDEDCFQSIEPDQNFYLNESGQLVIVFDEYEVAPGSMGSPEFVLPTDVLEGLLVQPSFLQ